MLTLDGARARDVRIALGAVDATAIRATAAESLLDGVELTDEAIAEAAEAAASECDPASDATTTAAYRRALVARLVRDVLVRVRSEAAGVSGTIGTSAPRARDLQLLTGRGRYVADLDLPGQVWARVVRSPVAHATLLGVATEAAREHRGVLAVLTAADVPDVRIPIRLPFAATSEGGQVLQPVLAREVVRYVGEPVALVLAEDPWAAEDAAELVELDLDVLDAAGDPVAASTGGPLVHEALGSNVVNTIPLRFGDVEAAFAAADVVVRRRLELQRQTGAPLETRGLLAEPVGGGVTIHGAAKVKHFNRGVLAELLGLALDDVRLVEVDVGGGFGVRGELYPEDVLVPFAALRLGRPVKWIEDRAEHLVATNHARGQVHDIEVAATAEGRLLALRGTAWVDQGAYVRTQGILPAILPGHHLPGPYAWEAFELTAHAVLTHRTPVGTYRGPGMTEAAFVRERLLDVLAAELRLDPVELRRRNPIPADRMPFVYDLGAESPPIAYESGVFAGVASSGCSRRRATTRCARSGIAAAPRVSTWGSASRRRPSSSVRSGRSRMQPSPSGTTGRSSSGWESPRSARGLRP